MFGLEVILYFHGTLAIICNLYLAGSYLTNPLTKYDSKASQAIIFITLLFIGNFLLILERYKPVEYATNTLRDIEAELLKKETTIIKLNGLSYKIDPNIKKQIGLILNKYISKNY